jgi:outer membrane protein
VLDEINAYLKTYGEARGYTIIFAATEYGNIAYGQQALDVTEEVLAGLNQHYGKTGK